MAKKKNIMSSRISDLRDEIGLDLIQRQKIEDASMLVCSSVVPQPTNRALTF